MKEETANVATPSVLYEAMLPSWNLMRALVGGTKAMRDAGIEYLPMEGGESDSGYSSRLNRSFLFPALQRTIQSLVGKVFAEPVTLQSSTSSVLDSFVKNVDLAGRNLNVFARDVFEAALRDGVTYVHVDYPKMTPGLTLADERITGARPYFRHVLAEDVIGWWSTLKDGAEKLLELRIKERLRVRSGEWGEEFVDQIRVYRPGMYEVYQKYVDANKKEIWKLVEAGNLSIEDEIPFRAIYTGRKGFMIAEPPLLNLAWMNVAHWQSSSDQRNILRIARVPFLFGAGLPEGGLADPKTGKFTLGASRVVTVADVGATLTYVEHTGAAIEAGKADLDDLKSEMSVMGFELLVKKPGNETATARAIDSAEINSALAAMALELQHALDECMKLALKWMGDQSSVVTCEVNTNYNISSEDAAVGQLLLSVRQAREISRTTFWAELQRRGILSDEFDADTEKDLLDNDVADMPDEPPEGDVADLVGTEE